MGAVLAVPTGPDNKSYKIIRDLSGQRAPQLLDEDISKIQCIFWIDDRPDSVRSLITALRLRFMPNHFVTFMRELEEKLYEMEKRARTECPRTRSTRPASTWSVRARRLRAARDLGEDPAVRPRLARPARAGKRLPQQPTGGRQSPHHPVHQPTYRPDNGLPTEVHERVAAPLVSTRG